MSTRMQRKKFKTVVFAALCLCLIACTVDSVYAYLVAKTEPISNEFIPAKVSCSVEEEFADGVKSNVKICNTGNIDSYIRAVVIATFVSEGGTEDGGEGGKVLSTAPVEGVDYTVVWAAEGDGWTKGADGYWYHTQPVKPNETTGILIHSAQKVSAPEGYRLHIQILATGIQSAPDQVVQEAWGVGVNRENGEIVVTTN